MSEMLGKLTIFLSIQNFKMLRVHPESRATLEITNYKKLVPILAHDEHSSNVETGSVNGHHTPKRRQLNDLEKG